MPKFKISCLFTIAVSMLCVALSPTTSIAAEFASKEEAIAMVKKGVTFLKASGKDKAFSEITSKSGQFRDRDLYLAVYGINGKCLAHGANEKQVGRDLLEMKDVDGKAFVRERVELAKANPSFWQDYKFTNPVTRKIEAKQMYCERVEDIIVCGGVYRAG